jgi:hypothetical protein
MKQLNFIDTVPKKIILTLILFNGMALADTSWECKFQATFHPLGYFLNPALALLGQDLKKSPIGQKLDFANHPYLCKGL